MEAPLIQLKGLYKLYLEGQENEVRALDGIDLTIWPGEFTAIVGTSGSGKSTMMNILGCLDVPSYGEYYLEGTPIKSRTQRELAQIRNQKIGFIFPVYAWRPPRIVIDFIEKLRFECFLNPYIFAVCTCGENAGDTMHILRSALRKKFWHLDSTAVIVMPNNYILSYDVDSPSLQQEKLDRAERTIQEINQGVLRKEKGILCQVPEKFSVLKTRAIGLACQKFLCNAKHFWVQDTCISCRLCQEICPVNNIDFPKGNPIWEDHCAQCLACINVCPVQAIQYKRATLQKGRYYHPDLLNKEN